METLNATHLVNYLPTSKSQTSLPPFSSSSSSSSSSAWFASGFQDRTTFVACKHHQISIRVTANSLAGRNRRKINTMGAVFSARCSADQSAGEGAARKPSKSWRNWVIGCLLSIALPFAHNRWAKLLAIKNGVETVVKTVETVVEVVEEVAEGVAKVADEVADHLPEGGKFKSAVEIVENMAKETAKNAHIADQLIDKVQEVGEEVGSMFLGKVDEINIDATKDEVAKDKSNQQDKVHEIATKVTQDQGIEDGN